MNDVLEIFEAHSDYTIDVRMSVLASTLAVLIAPYDDVTAASVMCAFNEVVAGNRQSLKKHLEKQHGH